MATDQYGARLPDGVVARLGTVRAARQGERVSALVYAADGKTLASGGEDGVVRLWDVASCRELRRFGEHPKQVACLAFTPNSQVLASGSQDGTIVLWEVATGRERKLIQSAAGPLGFLFPDDNTLLAACGDEQYHAWDLKTGAEITHDPTGLGPIKALAFVLDGQSVAVASWESTARLCDLTGQELRQFQGHRSSLQTVAISADGRTLASGSQDETIRLWEMATTKERLQFAGQREGVFALAFAPDGRTLASAGNDSTIMIWDLTGTPPPPKGPARPTMPAAKLMPSQLEQLWQDLIATDAPRIYRAIWGMALAGKQTVPFLKDRLKQIVPVDRQRVQALLADLNHEQYGRRDKAVEQLEKLGGLCEPLVRAAVQQPPSMDARRRMEKLLAKLEEPVPSSDALQVLHILETLELANTVEARQLLQVLSREDPPTRITLEAKAAYERLARRPAVAG
jgi:hypothetical protein